MTTSVTDEMLSAAIRAYMGESIVCDFAAFSRMRAALEAALRIQGKVVSEEDVVKMQALAESWRVKYYDHLGEPAYLKCAEDLTAIIGEGD